jgi:hypothetical protein
VKFRRCGGTPTLAPTGRVNRPIAIALIPEGLADTVPRDLTRG